MPVLCFRMVCDVTYWMNQILFDLRAPAFALNTAIEATPQPQGNHVCTYIILYLLYLYNMPGNVVCVCRFLYILYTYILHEYTTI